MRTCWTTMKRIISAMPRQADLYLSIIDEDGIISCANAKMLRKFELRCPRSARTNFYDISYPAHEGGLRKIIEQAEKEEGKTEIELYLKNGLYHPMKWQFNCLEQQHSAKKLYLCLGYKI